MSLSRSRHPGRGLRAGVGVIDLTPRRDRPVMLAGFGAGRLATGVRDPIEARALVLDDGRTCLALVSVDLLAVSLASVRRMRSLLGPGSAESLVVCATHSHSAPDSLGLWGSALFGVPIRSGVDPAWLEESEHAIARAVIEGARRLAPARVSLAEGRLETAEIVNLRRPELVDDRLLVIAVDGAGGRLANLVHLGCHPELLGPANTEISADFVGELRKRLDPLTGGTTLFFQGALGAMVTPRIEERATVAARARRSAELGASLAQSVAAMLARAEPFDPLPLALSRIPLRLPVSNPRFVAGGLLGLVDHQLSRDRGRWTIESELGMLGLGELRILLLPGEPDPEVTGLVEARVLALSNDELGYLLTDEALADPRFAYERSMSLGPGTVPKILGVLPWLEDGLDRIRPGADPGDRKIE